MIRNVLSTIPDDWAVQIFHLDNDQFRKGMALNTGLRHLVDSNRRVILTPIPAAIAAERKRPKYLMVHPWMWESMVAETVLLFGGNQVFCGNSLYKVFMRVSMCFADVFTPTCNHHLITLSSFFR